MRPIRFLLILAACLPAGVVGQVSRPSDAPKPLPPGESAKLFKVPPGYRVEPIASEPLIREPSGVCWDEHGRLFVSELHGYNLEGQYDIDELNKTGKLDHEVRRIPANERAIEAAKAGTYGTVKLLSDSNGDGVMDTVSVFADHLAPVYGVCPARGGIIAVCASDIVYLADRDGDGKAEVRETLFTGFATGTLERGINQPQWGPDDWIYVGHGRGGAMITGPHLAKPVHLGDTDFRIKSDGSAIEPITGTTRTIGFAFTEAGERFVATTSVAGLFVTPLPWQYLLRNSDAAAPRTEENSGDYRKVFPISKPHPWRTKRSEDPGFAQFYTKRYGQGETAPNGFFTSACSPLVYQDVALPLECRGAYFICEPAQNFVHRAIIRREGTALRLVRAPGEETSEFLASSDSWFHPVSLAHGPDGAVWIVDMYREIIEDYSAVPRYLQQQYGLTNGINHGRIWRLTHQDAPQTLPTDLSRMDDDMLAKEVASPHFWRRQTARRLLTEHKAVKVAPALSRLARETREPGATLNALFTLQALGALSRDEAAAALTNSSAEVRQNALHFAEPWLDARPGLLDQVRSAASESSPAVLLQLALTLGESKDSRVLGALAALAREHGNLNWMPNAILSSLPGQSGAVLVELLSNPESLGQAKALLEPFSSAAGWRHDAQELAQTLKAIAAVHDPALQLVCLRGLQAGLKRVRSIGIRDNGREALNQLLVSQNIEVRRFASGINELFQRADPATQKKLFANAAREVADFQLPVETRLAAVALLASSDDTNAPNILLAAWPVSTPKVRDAILDAIFLRSDRLPALVKALEQRTLAPNALTAFQRLSLLDHEQPAIRNSAAKLLVRNGGADDEAFQKFTAALREPRDPANGEKIFRDNCSPCHKVRGIGFNVGPDLGAEFQRAEDAILKDILAPNDTISASYPTFAVETKDGESFNGLLSSESATSVTLRRAGGLDQVVLRKDISRLNSLQVSLMPEGFDKILKPKDAADVIAWLREPGGQPTAKLSRRLLLFEDEPEFVAQLNEGDGHATLVTNGSFSGESCIAVTPGQRFSGRIPGWRYRIAEKPAPGQFRYMRLAWKAPNAAGVLIELAADGRWPSPSEPNRRYFAGRNTTPWQAREVSPEAPAEWRVVTFDLWKDCGQFNLTGIALTAMGGTALFDRIEISSALSSLASADDKKAGSR